MHKSEQDRPMMEDDGPRIVRRTGWLLIVAGVVDAILNFPVASTYELTGVNSTPALMFLIGGLCLITKKAWLIKYELAFSRMFLTGFAFGLVYFTMRLPTDLVWSSLKADNLFWVFVVTQVVYLLLLICVIRSLRSASVQEYCIRSGALNRGFRFRPAFAYIVTLLLCLMTTIYPDSAPQRVQERAEAIAKQDIGAGYKFHVNAWASKKAGDTNQYTALVTAWDANHVLRKFVKWDERTK